LGFSYLFKRKIHLLIFMTKRKSINQHWLMGFAMALMICLPSFLIAQQVDMSQFKAMKARSVGPAAMSGRITAIDAVMKIQILSMPVRPQEVFGNPPRVALPGNRSLMRKRFIPSVPSPFIRKTQTSSGWEPEKEIPETPSIWVMGSTDPSMPAKPGR
jgi:hypothetical protein